MAKRNGTWKVITIVGTFITVIIGAAITYGMLCQDVEQTHEEMNRVSTDVETIKQSVARNAENNAVVDRDIYYMQLDIEEIKADNKVIKHGVDVIIEKLDEE